MIAEYDTGGNVLRRYVHGPGTDEPIVWYEGSGTSDRRYLISDERGSVIGRTDGSGSVTKVNRYDAYGVPDAANQGRFQYTGQMWIPELGLITTRHALISRDSDGSCRRILSARPEG